jgi:hypothetical protein
MGVSSGWIAPLFETFCVNGDVTGTWGANTGDATSGALEGTSALDGDKEGLRNSSLSDNKNCSEEKWKLFWDVMDSGRDTHHRIGSPLDHSLFSFLDCNQKY